MKAVITGAASGIGKAFAEELSKKKVELILVDKDEAGLKRVAKDKNAKIIVANLANLETVRKTYQAIAKSNKDIDLLVNCAGLGHYNFFNDKSVEDYDVEMLNVNIIALDRLTKYFINYYIEKNISGRIINVASIAGSMPGPKMAIYYASKAYVIRLDEAINEELDYEGYPILVSTLCPGPTNTHFNETANVRFMSPEGNPNMVAACALRGIKYNRHIIVPGLIAKVIYYTAHVFPSNIMAGMAYFFQSKLH